MKIIHKVTNHHDMYPALSRFRCIKDIPKNLGTPILLDFGLWGQWYCVKGFHGLKCVSGTEMPFHIAHLYSVGRVIGPKDLEAAKGRPWAEEWRESYQDAIRERMGLLNL